MKIKNTILRKILLGVIGALEKIQNKLFRTKRRNNNKLAKDANKIVNSYVEQTKKVGINSKLENKIIITSIDQLDFYVDDCNGNIMKLEDAIKVANEEIKTFKHEHIKTLNGKIIDEYMNKKYIIDNMIKTVYFKAKKLIISINGILLRANEEYRKSIDKFLEIRNNILYNSYQMLQENKFLLKFVLDNNIDNDEKFDDCADILTKMYITEKDQSLYDRLSKFNNLFCAKSVQVSI